MQENHEPIESFRQRNESTDALDATNNTNKLLYKRATSDLGESFYKYATKFPEFFPFAIFIWINFFDVVNLFLISRFEDAEAIGSFGDNASIEYNVQSSSDSVPITGAPISYQDNTDASTNYLANNIDFGEFLDSTADIYPNKLKHAVCGKLTIKYVSRQNWSTH